MMHVLTFSFFISRCTTDVHLFALPIQTVASFSFLYFQTMGMCHFSLCPAVWFCLSLNWCYSLHGKHLTPEHPKLALGWGCPAGLCGLCISLCLLQSLGKGQVSFSSKLKGYVPLCSTGTTARRKTWDQEKHLEINLFPRSSYEALISLLFSQEISRFRT